MNTPLSINVIKKLTTARKWVELQSDGSLEGQICFHNGGGAEFIAKPWKTSSTAW